MLTGLFAALILCLPQLAADDAGQQRALLRQLLPLLAERPMSAELVAAYQDLHDRAWRLGDIETAHAALERIVPWWAAEEQHGGDPSDFAETLSHLAKQLAGVGDYAAAGPLYERALASLESLGDAAQVDLGRLLNNLATLRKMQGELTASRTLFERALSVREAALGPGHPAVATTLDGLGRTLAALGEPARARLMLEQALSIREAVYGPDHPSVAGSLNSLASLFLDLGDFGRARVLYERALAIQEAALGPDHPRVAGVLSNLASVLARLGDDAGARALFERSLAIMERVHGPSHPDVALCLNNLANLLSTVGDAKGARALYERALAIRETVLGPLHPEVANSLVNLAGVLWDLGDGTAARALYERAVEIQRVALGPRHPALAISLNNLAWMLDDVAEARSLFEQALTIGEDAHGRGHPDVSDTEANLALLALDEGRAAEAFGYVRRLAAGRGRRRRLLASLTEGESFQYLARLRWQQNTVLAAATAAGDEQAAYAAVLDSKGQVARLTLQVRAQLRDGPGTEEPLVESLQGSTARLSRLALESDVADRREHEARLESLRAERDALERDLRRRLEPAEGPPITVRAVRRSLPLGSVLVDLSAYRAYLPGTIVEGCLVERGHWSEPRMGAWILRAGEDTLRSVDLGPVAAIEEAVQAFLGSLVRRRGRSLVGAPGAAGPSEEEINASLRALVWDPLGASVDGARTIFLSPDGVLCTLPFETLQSRDGRFLIEDHAFVYPSDATSLVGLAQRVEPLAASADSLLAIGGVDFRECSEPAPPRLEAGSSLRGRFHSYWGRLPATRYESQVVHDLHEEAFGAGGRRLLLQGAAASEERLEAELPRFTIAHLATHGFFQPEGLPSLWQAALDALEGQRGPQPGASSRRVAGLHPGLLSGLVLAGANRPPGGDEDRDDGYLTASEVMLLDLSSVELVVLSACETGLGRPQSGEGLLGLRRAFLMAGAQTVISSLWSVSDESTGELMQDLYANLFFKGLGRHEALRAAQLAMLARNRGESGAALPSTWGAFVLSGEWR